MARGAEAYVRAEITYADQSSLQRLDLYTPVCRSGPFPIVIWIHGGGFRVGDKRSMPHVDRGPPPTATGPYGPYQIQVPDVTALTRMGYAVVSLNYRLGNSMRAAALDALRDGKAAVRYLRANADALQIDATRFAVWGNSAGGFIAAMLGVTGDQPTPFDDPESTRFSSEVQAVIVWFGAEDRLPEPFKLPPYIDKAKTLPPFLIVNGSADPVISPEQARRLHDALVRRGAFSTLTIVEGAGHENPLFMATQMQPAFAFLQNHLAR